MRRNLYQAAKEYVGLLDKIERTKDTDKLQAIKETRVELHWEFIDLLKKQGIRFKDRNHATRIALRIA